MAFSIFTLLYIVLILPLSTLPRPPDSRCLPFFLPNSLPCCFLTTCVPLPILPHPLLPSCAALSPFMTYTHIFESRFHGCEETCGVCLFWVCFISLSIMISSSVYFPTSPGISFSFIEKWNSIVCVNHILVVHSADDGHRGWFSQAHVIAGSTETWKFSDPMKSHI